MFRNFANQIFSGKLNDEWPEIALKPRRLWTPVLSRAAPREMCSSDEKFKSYAL
jgi:hypothetical protein